MRLDEKIRSSWPKFRGPKSMSCGWWWMQEENLQQFMVDVVDGEEGPMIPETRVRAHPVCSLASTQFAVWQASAGYNKIQKKCWYSQQEIDPKKVSITKGCFQSPPKLPERPCRFGGQTRLAFSLCCAYGWSIGGEGANHWELIPNGLLKNSGAD